MALGFLATTARSDEITLSLPTDLAALLADALDHLREASSGGERSEALDTLAEQLDAPETPHLTGPRDVVRELLAVAIDEAGERVAGASARLLRGDDAAAELRARLNDAGALLELLERSSAAPSSHRRRRSSGP